MGVYIMAEAGVNHNGSLEIARQLCKAAKDVGADAIKFQTWKTEKLLTKHVGQAAYQSGNTGRVESQYDMLKRLELSYDDRALKHYCDEIGIQFASKADEQDSLDVLVSLGSLSLKSVPVYREYLLLRYIRIKEVPLFSVPKYMADVALSIVHCVKVERRKFPCALPPAIRVTCSAR